LAANVDSGNVLAGKTYEFVPRTWRRGAAVRFLACADTAVKGFLATIKIDTTSLMDKETISYAARHPQIPEDQLIVHWAPPGARLFLNFNGGATGGTTVSWKVDVEPV